MRAEILTIGDELCRGEIVDTNSSYLAQRLWDLDITTRWMTSCCDDMNDITAAVRQAAQRADVIVCSGGLGPTEDDLTVDCVAALAGVEAVIDEPARERMAARFASAGLPLAPIQLRQVRVPNGARVLGNPAGLAPAFVEAVAGVPVVCLPGVPRELHAICEQTLDGVLAEMREAAGDVERIARRTYRAFGRGESQISQACRGIVDGVAGASIHYQVKFPETLVKLVVRDRDRAAAEARLAAMDAVLRERLARVVYGTGEDNLIAKVTRRLIASGLTIATAESCTGGLIGELLTALPGSSKIYRGGAIVYANEEKVRQLGVRPATLETHGAVSEDVVREMASGIRERAGTDLAVAVSGIAGPDGGTPDKPVGTAWIGLSGLYDASPPVDYPGQPPGSLPVELRYVQQHLRWPGARDQIRTLSAWWAFKLIDDTLDELEAGTVYR